MSNETEKHDILSLLAAAGPGSTVKALLTLKNISQTELSAKLGITPSEISRVISGKRKTPHIRKAIAAELSIPVEVLFETTDVKRKTEGQALKQVKTSEEALGFFKA